MSYQVILKFLFKSEYLLKGHIRGVFFFFLFPFGIYLPYHSSINYFAKF